MRWAVILLGILSSGQLAYGQGDDQTVDQTVDQGEGLLRGTIYQAGSQQRLAGANIQLLGTVLGTVSDLQGEFVIARVPAGRYRLRASMIGYGATLVPVEMPTDEILEIRLQAGAISLNPVVVTADRRPQTLDESSTSVAVLAQAEIEARTSLRLDDALEMVPGVYFMEDDINIRGATGYRANAGSRVLLLLDGVPVMTSDTGGISWDLIPVQDIERVEVVKGAGSALWGSGAIGGVVNVITRRPSSEGLFTFRSALGLYDEPSEAEWVWAPERRLHYERVDLGYSRSIGSTHLRLSTSRYTSTGDRRAGDFSKWTMSGLLGRTFNDGSEIEVYLAWLRDHSGVFVQWRSPFEPDSTATAPAQLFHPLLPDEEGNLLRLTWLNSYVRYTRLLSPRSHLRVRASLLRSIIGNQFDRAGEFSPAHGPAFEVQMDWLPTDRHFLTVGIDTRLHLVEGDYFEGSHTEIATAAFFQDEWRLQSNLRLTGGLRIDRHALDGGEVVQQLNPRFGLNFRPTATLALRTSAGRGFRVPTTAERSMSFKAGNFQVVPSQHLDPESSWSYEAGLRQTLGDASYVDAAVFHSDYRDFVEPLVDLAQTASRIVVSFQNVDDAHIRGVELAAGTRLLSRRLLLEGGLTFLDSEDHGLKRPLAYRPRWSTQLSPSLHLGRCVIRIDYRYASRLQRVAIYANDQRVAQHELNLRLQLERAGMTWSAGVNNALNYNYTQLERNLGEIRSFVVGVHGAF
jgi:outer membrane receptor for ferrienterochelin and colicins